jgi:hypothetical protein
MKRAVAWVALAVAAGCAIYGFSHERLFDQTLWSPQGLDRLAGFSAVFWILAGLILWRRPGWLGAVVAASVLVYSVWWCSRFFMPVAPLAVIYFLGSSFLLGRWVARKADGITALLLGLSIWIFIISIVVRFPVNTRAVYFVAFAIPYAMRGADLLPVLRVMLGASSRLSRKDAAGFAVLLFVLLLQWIVALKPEVSSDGLSMHLAIPMAVAHDARWTFDFSRHTWALMPMAGDWAFTAAYLLGGEAAARLLNFAMLVAIAAMICRTSRQWLPRFGAFLAAALFVSTPLVQLVTGSLLVENVWAALILGGTLALARGEVVYAGVLFGAAMSAKVGSVAFAIPAVVVAAIALVRRKDAPHRLRTAAVAIGLFLIFAAPPYANAWWKTCNPIYPFMNNVFRSPYFEPANVFHDARFQKKLDWKTPYDTTFRSGQYFEGQKGGLGFQYFLFLAPLLLLFNRRAPRTVIVVGLAGAALTLTSQPNIRYLYPALPLLSIGIAWVISEAFRPEMPTSKISAVLVGVVALVLLNVWFFPAATWDQDFALFRRDQVEDYLKALAPQRSLIEYLNRTAPGEPVGFFGGSSIAGLNAPAYTDRWHTYAYWKRLLNASRPEDVAAQFRELGIRHVITPLPVDTEDLPVRYFIERWTAPTGVTAGNWALRDVRAAPVIPPLPPPVPPGTYDDYDFRIQYRGAWARGRQFTEASGSTLSYSNRTGDELGFAFDGSAIVYVYTMASNRGIAQVRIDGRVRAEIDMYADPVQWQAQTTFTDLGSGAHTIEIRVTGRKNGASTDDFIDLDRFIVR